jgi:hypothetical protein
MQNACASWIWRSGWPRFWIRSRPPPSPPRFRRSGLLVCACRS